MFDRVDANRIAHQAGGVVDWAEVADGRRDLETSKIGSSKSNAGTRRGRLERKGHLSPGMQSNPRAGCGSLQCPLCAHQALGLQGDEVLTASRVPRRILGEECQVTVTST